MEHKDGNKDGKHKVRIVPVALLAVAAVASLAFGLWTLRPPSGSAVGSAAGLNGVVNAGKSAGETLNVEKEAYTTTMVLYDGPKTIAPSVSARISLNGENVFVYDAAVNMARQNKGDYDLSSLTTTPMTYFDFGGGAVDVEIDLFDETVESLEKATVSPLALGITPVIDGRIVRFTITEPGFYTVQFNGSPWRAVHIFANPLETDLPDRNDENVLWIDPGEWNIENIGLQSGQTLYISGGAVVHTTVNTQFASNVTIRGRGMIDGGNWDTWRGNEAHVPVDFRYCNNVRVEGIIINNSNSWCFNSFETERALVDNVKIISARPNGDGFTLQSCRYYTVQNSFARTWDDTCVVKNYEGNTSNITFRDMTLWTDLAQSCEIGYETNKGKKPNSRISNVLFENITVVNAFHKPVLSIHNSDDALVENVTYRNVTVENAAMGMGDAGDNRQLIDITIAPSVWNSTKTRGTVRNITYENINVLAGTIPPTVRFAGYDTDFPVEGVHMKNITIFGERVTSLDGLRMSKKFASDITLE